MATMLFNKKYRPLDCEEIELLCQQRCSAQNWSDIVVAEGFDPKYLVNVSFSGAIRLGVNGKEISCGSGVIRHAGIYNAMLHNCTIGDNVLIYNVGRYIANYDIEDDVVIENVGQISCDGSNAFGNGTEVSAINEAGGREVPIYDELTAQIAYIMAMYRHRNRTIERSGPMPLWMEPPLCAMERSTVRLNLRLMSVRM